MQSKTGPGTGQPQHTGEVNALDENALNDVSGGCGCEFPAQQIDLKRTVNISNTAPPVSEVKTDPCGNILP